MAPVLDVFDPTLLLVLNLAGTFVFGLSGGLSGVRAKLDVFGVVVIYALAKVAEALDAPIYSLGHIVSGHTIKHLLAALAAWWLLRMLQLRAPLSPPSSGRRKR